MPQADRFDTTMDRLRPYPEEEPDDDGPERGREARTRASSLRRFTLKRTHKATRRQRRDGEIIGGRPYLVAHIPGMDIPGDAQEFREFRERYHEILQGLTYQEQQAWCRAFKVSRSTFLGRKYGHRDPKLEEVILTLYWWKLGKPTRYHKHRYTSPGADAGQVPPRLII